MNPTVIEIPLKQWLYEQADNLHISFHACEERYRRKKIPQPSLHKINSRVIFVQVNNPQQPCQLESLET
jgi:hypothetical protein